MAKLSVIIPAFNRAGLIGESIRSLLSQTLLADEIIVVDDGSTDGTAEVAEGFGPSVTVIRQENGGPATARNTGFQASIGEYIHFFDSDDLAAANKHEVQVAALDRSGADIAYCPWVQGYFRGDVFEVHNHVLQQHGLPGQNDLVRSLLSSWSVVPHAAVFRRSIVEKVNGFPEDLFGTEDQFMFLRSLLAGAQVIHTPGTIQFYRLGDPSKITESKDGATRHLREWARFLLKARSICLESGIDPLRWFGYRQRLWEVEQDLGQVILDDGQLLEEIGKLSHGHTPQFGYLLHRQWQRWRGGLQLRLTGGRAHHDFHIGPMTPEQISMLAKLGYKVSAKNTGLWRPRNNSALADC